MTSLPPGGIIRGSTRPPSGHRAAVPPEPKRRCLRCDAILWSGNDDSEQLCWPCRQIVDAHRTTDEEPIFRLMFLIRLLVQFGEAVDMACFFNTDDRDRLRRAARFWRRRGWDIRGDRHGDYRVMGFEDVHSNVHSNGAEG